MTQRPMRGKPVNGPTLREVKPEPTDPNEEEKKLIRKWNQWAPDYAARVPYMRFSFGVHTALKMPTWMFIYLGTLDEATSVTLASHVR